MACVSYNTTTCSTLHFDDARVRDTLSKKQVDTMGNAIYQIKQDEDTGVVGNAHKISVVVNKDAAKENPDDAPKEADLKVCCV